MNVGERIKKSREERGMSVIELANILGVSRATIYRYESNEIEKLPVDILIPISKALNVTPTFLMGMEENKPDTLAAHFEGEDFTPEEIDKIVEYATFLKSTRKE